MNLRALADAIPALGHGGKDIAAALIQYALFVRPGLAIVDIGPYLGSTTGYLLLGADPRVEIHAFDTWDARICDLRPKARHYHNMELPNDLRPLFLANVTPLLRGHRLVTHQGDVRSATYGEPPIGLLVDDIGVDREYTEAKMATFGPHLIPGAVLMLADYFWFETKAGAVFRGQRDYMEAHRDRFDFIERIGIAAVFEVIK